MSKENLLLIEEVLDAEKSKEDRQIILEGLKDQIKEFEKDADADFQEEIDRVKSKFGIGGAKKSQLQRLKKSQLQRQLKSLEQKPLPNKKQRTERRFRTLRERLLRNVKRF